MSREFIRYRELERQLGLTISHNEQAILKSEGPHCWPTDSTTRHQPPSKQTRFYSERMATIGCTAAARRAGARPARTATSIAIAAPAT